MEVVGWHGALSNLEIDVLASEIIIRAFVVIGLRVNILQESLNMASGVFRASSIESVRQ